MDAGDRHENPGAASPWIVVAIPVCNERDAIVACLDALVAQIGLDYGALGIVLLLNNCNDGTDEIVRDYVSTPWPIRVISCHDPNASAGWARRIAMDAASDWLAEGGHVDGVLLTTDADSRVGHDWVSRNLAALEAGADAVAGRIELDPDDAARLPAQLKARGRLEDDYERLLTEIDARIDPQPGDPWPCHWANAGATLAVRWSAYKTVGGMPDMATGEDRAFIEAVQVQGFIVRHAPDIVVVTSGRLEGRASGGVADTMKLRCAEPESPCDARLEKVSRVIARALIRRLLRSLYAGHRLASNSWLLRGLSIPQATMEGIATLEATGVLAIERSSPRLCYRPVRPSDLPGQIRNALLALRLLQGPRPSRGTLDKSATPRPATARSPNMDARTPNAPST